jgi:hypothetical protein
MGCVSLVVRARSGASILGVRETDRLAADRIVLPQRVTLPVVVHEDPPVVRMVLDRDAHQVPRFPLVPVGGWPNADDRRHALAVIEPDLDAENASVAAAQREQVVVHREALRLRLRQPLVALRHRRIEVAACRRPDVPGDAGRPSRGSPSA